MTSGKRLGPPWKFLRVLALCILILVGSVWFWVRSMEARHWSRLEQRVAALSQEATARNGARAVLRGTSAHGNAWDDYLKAVELLKGGLDHLKISAFVDRSAGADRAAIESILAKHGTALDCLQKGTQRGEARRSRIHDGAASQAMPKNSPLRQLHDLANLAVCRSRFLVEKGKLDDAVQLLLDLCQFGHDLGRDGSLFAEVYGNAVCGLALTELKDLVCSGTVTPANLSQIDRELEILGGSFPLHETALLSELVIFGDILLKEQFFSYYTDVNRPPRPSDLLSWRYGYSSRLMQSAAFEQEDAWMMRVKNADQGSWVDEKRQWGDIQAEAMHTSNVVIEYFRLTGHGPCRVRRDRLAQLRLLRTAAHYLVTGNILELDDPFGSKLKHSEAFDVLRLWSVGKNGTDDGGKGDWKGSHPDDIVFDVRR